MEAAAAKEDAEAKAQQTNVSVYEMAAENVDTTGWSPAALAVYRARKEAERTAAKVATAKTAIAPKRMPLRKPQDWIREAEREETRGAAVRKAPGSVLERTAKTATASGWWEARACI